MKTLIAALAFTGLLAVGPGASAALHSGNGTPTAVILKATGLTKQSLQVAFASSHHVPAGTVSGYGAVKYASYGKAEYALGSFRVKGSKTIKASFMPEAFSRVSRAARWQDKGATFGKPCKQLPAAVAKLFGYGQTCAPAAVPPTTTTTATPTETTPTLPAGPPTVTPPPATPGTPIDVALVSIAGAVSQGQNCVVTYTVHNNGPDDGMPIVNKITVTTPAGVSTSADDKMLEQLGGQQTSQSVPVPVDCSASGTYTLTVQVDAANDLKESDEQNNISRTTTNPSTTTLPDLLVTGAGVSNCNTAWLTVKNQGNAASPAESVDLLLRVVNNQTQMWAGGQQFDMPALAPGDSQTLSMPYTGPCSNITVIGNADSFSKITESDESNNYISLTQ